MRIPINKLNIVYLVNFLLYSKLNFLLFYSSAENSNSSKELIITDCNFCYSKCTYLIINVLLTVICVKNCLLQDIKHTFTVTYLLSKFYVIKNKYKTYTSQYVFISIVVIFPFSYHSYYHSTRIVIPTTTHIFFLLNAYAFNKRINHINAFFVVVKFPSYSCYISNLKIHRIIIISILIINTTYLHNYLFNCPTFISVLLIYTNHCQSYCSKTMSILLMHTSTTYLCNQSNLKLILIKYTNLTYQSDYLKITTIYTNYTYLCHFSKILLILIISDYSLLTHCLENTKWGRHAYYYNYQYLNITSHNLSRKPHVSSCLFSLFPLNNIINFTPFFCNG